MRLVTTFTFILLLVACTVPKTAAVVTYTLVQLKTGSCQEPLTKAESATIFGGHFANMGRLAREGSLLVAGPYGKEKSDPALRGLFVLDTADREQAEKLAATDPGFVAGLFRFEFASLTTAAPLRALRVADLAAHDAIVASGRTPSPGEGCRNYVLLSVENGDAAAAALAGNAAVLAFARLDGRRALLWLDAKDKAAASALLRPFAARLGAFQLDEWFGSGLLADLPTLAGC